MFPKKKLKPDANKKALDKIGKAPKGIQYVPQRVVKKQPSFRKKK